MITVERLAKRINTSPAGVSCVFVGMNRWKGIKFYRSASKRDFCMELQESVYHTCGLAPQVFEKFDAAGLYGFVTERAKVLIKTPSNAQKDRARQMGWRAEQKLYDGWDEAKDPYREEISRIKKIIYDASKIVLSDCHAGNFGLIGRNDQLVPIDFDHCYYQPCQW